MNDMELISKLADIVRKKKTHKYYERVCKLATLYKQIMTNEDTDPLFRQVVKREESEWFKQRKRLTNLVLMPISNHIRQPLTKVSRSNDLKREIKYKDDATGTKTAEIETLLHHYQGDKSLEDYTRNRLIDLSDIDPNGWIVQEWPTVDKPSDKRVQPYPYEVSSQEAVMFEYLQYTLQYLVVKYKLDEKKELFKYTIYGQNQTVIFTQIEREKAEKVLTQVDEVQIYDNQMYICINRYDYYAITISIPHNLGYVPATRAGYIPDLYTNGTTFVNVFHKATPYLLDTVKSKSEKDLTFALHTFPKLLQYEQTCPVCGGSRTNVNGEICGACKGTGTMITTSTQDVTTFPMPRDKEEFIDLNGLVAFVRPPTDIIQVMIDNLDKLKQDAFEAVWGKNTFVEGAGQVTAEQIISQENSKYDNLFRCAEHICNYWTFAAKTIAKVTALDANLEIWMSVGKEFSVRSKEELTLIYKTQKDAGMSSDVVTKTEREIMKLDLSNEPYQLRRYDIRSLFRPFSDKTAEQINVILSDKTETTLEDRVLWKNYDSIWDSLELVDENIYSKKVKEIKVLLDAATKKLILQINKQQAITGYLDLNAPDREGDMATGEDGTPPVNIEAEAKAKLKGTVGGIQGLIEINKAVFEGIMSETAAELLIMEIYGFDSDTAKRLIELPEQKTITKINEIKDEIE